MTKHIEHEKEYQQFTIKLGDDDAELAYSLPDENVICFTHTYVPASERGNGMASKLIEAGLQFAKEHKYKVKAQCPAVSNYLKSHPEHNELLA